MGGGIETLFHMIFITKLGVLIACFTTTRNVLSSACDLKAQLMEIISLSCSQYQISGSLKI